jgi:hypothetical protein
MSAESADLLRIAAAVSDGQAVDWDLESRRTGADVRDPSRVLWKKKSGVTSC